MFKSSEERKQESMMILSKLKIPYIEHLPAIEDSTQVELKDVDLICKKAIATLLIIQVAHDALRGEFKKSKGLFSDELKKYGVEEYLSRKENIVLNGYYSKQDLLDITWEYETYWALVWALGLIDSEEMDIPDKNADWMKAIRLVSESNSYEDFKAQVKLRSIEEILDMLDLYYRYNWATVEARVRSRGRLKISHEVVVERRKGLEWLISSEEDWDDISLDT